MPTSLTSKRSDAFTRRLIGAVLFASACAHVPAYEVPPDGRRRPDGVAVDPLDTPPPAEDAARASAGVVALRAPLGTEEARATARAFFDAVAREDGEALQRVLAFDAVAINPSTKQREDAFASLSRRFGRLDYTQLAGLTFWQEGQVFRGSEAAGAWADVVGSAPAAGALAPPTVDALEPSDVVIKTTIVHRRTATQSLLGEEVVLALRRDAGGYVVYRIVEDFTLSP